MVSVSIIVPLYQSASTISKCISSIINQSYTDFELLLIDDGSSDNSKEICQWWQEKDTRIKYIYQENKGVSSARNKGLELAIGEWIIFIDSDDWIENCYLEHFHLSEQQVDIILTGYKEVNRETIIEHSAAKDIQGLIHAHPEYVFELEVNKFFNPPWGKVFLRKHIEQYSLRFNPEYSYGEDKLFVLSYLIHCKSWKILPQTYYNYNIGNGLAAKPYPYSIIWKWNDELLCLLQILGFTFSLSKEQIRVISQNSYCYFTLYMINSLYQYNYPKEERLRLIHDIYLRKRDLFFFRSYKCQGKTMKIGSWCYRLNKPWLTDIVYQLIWKMNKKKGLM